MQCERCKAPATWTVTVHITAHDTFHTNEDVVLTPQTSAACGEHVNAVADLWLNDRYADKRSTVTRVDVERVAR